MRPSVLNVARNRLVASAVPPARGKTIPVTNHGEHSSFSECFQSQPYIFVQAKEMLCVILTLKLCFIF